MGSIQWGVVWAALLLGYCCRCCQANDGLDELRRELASMHQWLDDSPSGPGWRRFLRSDRLEEEISKGPAANRRNVAAILGRYRSGEPGLDRTPFARVRQSLSRWADGLRVPMALRWAAELRSSRGAYRPIDNKDVSSARSELADAASQLDDYLMSGTRANALAWKKFLKWDVLDSHLNGDADTDELQRGPYPQFFNGSPGLQLPRFVAVRKKLRRYLTLHALHNDANAERKVRAQLDALATAIVDYNDQPSTKTAQQIARQLDWLGQIGQISELATDIRKHYLRPNVFLQVSETFVARGFADTVDEPTPVNEMILGTRVRGMGRTTGTVTADIVPARDHARIDVVMTGATDVRTIGTQDPVRIHGHSHTSISARKSLVLDAWELTEEPARASCSTRTTLLSVVSMRHLGRRLIESVAWKRARQQLPQAQQVASRRAERRIAGRIDSRARDLVFQGDRRLKNELRRPLIRRGLEPSRLYLSSTDQHLLLSAVQAAPAQFATFGSPPAVLSTNNDVLLQVHESVVNNTAEQGLAGLTLTDERAAELTEKVLGSVPDELEIDGDQPRWSMSFDWAQPLTVDFADEKFRLAVRGRRFTSGERILEKIMEISGRYRMQTTPSGVNLTREGEIDVTFPTNRSARLSIDDLFFKTLMQKKFAGLFKPKIVGEGLAMPGRFERMGKIYLRQLSAREGWLSLGWR